MMKLFNRKSQLQRLLETVNDSLDAPRGFKLSCRAAAAPARR